MSIFLYMPGLLVILFRRRGLASVVRYLLTIIAVQMSIAASFLQHNPWAYLRFAFDFGRVFLYKWTVNWRFVDEEVFLSRQWSLGLLVGQISLLTAFGLFKWCKPDGGVKVVIERGFRRPLSPAGLTPLAGDGTSFVHKPCGSDRVEEKHRCGDHTLHFELHWDIVRSLPALPVLFLVRSPVALLSLENKVSPAFQVSRGFLDQLLTPWLFCPRLALLVIVEYAWNTYPSTTISSSLLFLAHGLLAVGLFLQ